MKKVSGHRVTMTLAIIAFAASVSACSSETASRTSSPAKGQVVEYLADYPVYDSADHLFGRANLVVQATVSGRPVRTQKLMPETNGTDPKLNPAVGAPGGQVPTDSDAVVITVYRAAINKVFKGPVKVGQSVEIQEMGGTLNGITYKEKHAHPLVGGKSYVLFLETFPNAPAALLNPLQGQYPLDSTAAPIRLTGNPVTVTTGDLKRLDRKS